MQTLTAIFHQPLRPSQIDDFRKAVTTFTHNDLFHNHDEQSTISRYPLIHYRVHGGKAAIFAVNEGAQACQDLLKNKEFVETFGGMYSQDTDRNFEPHILAEPCKYRVYHYIPFNPETYPVYKQLPDMKARIELLESQLHKHINSMLSTLHQPQDGITISIYDLDRVEKVKAYGAHLMAFDLVINANILLPDRIAIGRKMALGYGWMYKM
ncbi:MAG: hypothetical protein K1X55_10105 [Chitinophagales bacterium]|nr:hypothetical protein [Chitinophagales bacterium]